MLTPMRVGCVTIAPSVAAGTSVVLAPSRVAPIAVSRSGSTETGVVSALVGMRADQLTITPSNGTAIDRPEIVRGTNVQPPASTHSSVSPVQGGSVLPTVVAALAVAGASRAVSTASTATRKPCLTNTR